MFQPVVDIGLPLPVFKNVTYIKSIFFKQEATMCDGMLLFVVHCSVWFFFMNKRNVRW